MKKSIYLLLIVLCGCDNSMSIEQSGKIDRLPELRCVAKAITSKDYSDRFNSEYINGVGKVEYAPFATISFIKKPPESIDYIHETIVGFSGGSVLTSMEQHRDEAIKKRKISMDRVEQSIQNECGVKIRKDKTIIFINGEKLV